MSEKTIITFEGVKYHLVGAGLPKRGEMYLDMVEQKVLKASFNHATNSQIIVKPVKWKPVIGKDVYVIYVGSGRIIKKMFTNEYRDLFEAGLVRQTKEEAKDLLENLQQTVKEFDL